MAKSWKEWVKVAKSGEKWGKVGKSDEKLENAICGFMWLKVVLWG